MINFEPETCPETNPNPARKPSTRHASTSNGVDKAIRRPRKPNQRESDSAPAGIEFWKTVPRDPGHRRCFRKTAARGCWPTPRSSTPSGRNYACAGQNSGKLQGAPNRIALDFSPHCREGVGNVAIPCATITLDQRERCTLSLVRGQGGHRPGFTQLAGITRNTARSDAQ